jgi:hypothetical protein
VVTLNNHGIRDNLAGKGVYFTTDGALPTGITADTVYYARRNDDNTFHLYDTEAHAADTGSTTGIINTSSAGSGTHTVRGAYYKNLTTEQKARYGASGSERIYDGVELFQSSRVSDGVTVFDNEIAEVGEAYDDYATVANVNLAIGSYSIEITTFVNGVRSSGFHSGVVDTGYRVVSIATGSYWTPTGVNIVFDGFSYYQSTTSRSGVNMECLGPIIKNFIFQGNASSSSVVGLILGKPAAKVFNCIFVGGWGRSILYRAGTTALGCVVCNNSFYGKSVGDKAFALETGVTTYQTCCNNVAVDHVTWNWDTGYETKTSFNAAWNNAGESGDTIWTKGGATVHEVTSAAFVDAANANLAIAANSPLVGVGILTPDQPTTDILGKPRIQKISVTQEFSYDNLSGSFDSWSIISWGTGGTAGTGRLVEVTEVGTAGTMGLHLISGVAPTDGLEITDGTATCDVDGTVTTGERWVDSPGCSIGAFEYDYGAPPPATTITLSANVSLAGAEVRIYENASGDYIGDEVVGTESNPDSTYAFEYPSGDTVVIQILKSGYVEYIQAITVPESDFTLPISLVADINA